MLDVIAGYDPNDLVTAYSVVCLLYRAGRPGPEGADTNFSIFPIHANHHRNTRRLCCLGMAVSRDETWLLFSQYDHRAQDLMLVENFR